MHRNANWRKKGIEAMKQKLAVYLLALVCAGAVTPTSSFGAHVVIEIGDRPYYRHGAWYWDSGVRWYWVPGHWRWHHGHHVWVHGYYAPR